MIAYLHGTLLERHPQRVVLDVQGVGYELQVPVSTYAQMPALGAVVALHVYTHVREDAIQLFGFGAAAEKRLFEKLIGVNGIGPKLALTMLSGLNPEALIEAIRHGDLVRLTAVPGVGKKTAERVVMELRDKLQGESAPEGAGVAGGSVAEDVVSALVNLGYALPLAQRAAARNAASAPAASFDEMFLACMKSLGE